MAPPAPLEPHERPIRAGTRNAVAVGGTPGAPPDTAGGAADPGSCWRPFEGSSCPPSPYLCRRSGYHRARSAAAGQGGHTRSLCGQPRPGFPRARARVTECTQAAQLLRLHHHHEPPGDCLGQEGGLCRHLLPCRCLGCLLPARRTAARTSLPAGIPSLQKAAPSGVLFFHAGGPALPPDAPGGIQGTAGHRCASPPTRATEMPIPKAGCVRGAVCPALIRRQDHLASLRAHSCSRASAPPRSAPHHGLAHLRDTLEAPHPPVWADLSSRQRTL